MRVAVLPGLNWSDEKPDIIQFNNTSRVMLIKNAETIRIMFRKKARKIDPASSTSRSA